MSAGASESGRATMALASRSSLTRAKVRNSEQVSGGGNGGGNSNNDRFFFFSFKMATEAAAASVHQKTTTTMMKCSARTMKCKREGAKPHLS